MTDPQTLNTETLLDAAKRVLPDARVLATINDQKLGENAPPLRMLVAVPNNTKVEQLDFSAMAAHPDRTKAKALAADLPTLLDYLHRHHHAAETTVWVLHNPETSSLSITGRLNDHSATDAGWADHTINYTPALSVEWKRWTKHNGQVMNQLEFANFLEDNLADIHPGDVQGMPTAGDMLQMALAFEAVQDMRVKSHARTQDGGIKLEFADQADDTTAKKMEAFARFRIAVPVFYGGARFPLVAKLRFNARKAVPEFWFELIRPDQTHLAASLHLIDELRSGLSTERWGGTQLPVFMGAA